MTTRSRLAAVAAWTMLLTVAGAVVWLALTYDSLHATLDFSLFAAPLAGMAVITGTVGLLIRLRRPGNWIGRLMAAGPILMLSGFAGYAIGAIRATTDGPTDVLAGLGATWGAAAVLPGIFLTYPAVVILFPDGRLPSRRWRLAVAPVIAGLGVSSLLLLVTPTTGGVLPANPLAIPGLGVALNQAAAGLGTLALIGSALIAVLAVVVRFRAAVGVERQQLKWLVASVALAGVLFPVSFGTDVGPAGLIDILSLGAVALIPTAIGVAILRYRLYEIDRVISRTIGWAIVTGVLVAVFSGGVIVLQSALAPVTNQDTLAVAASTLVAFALFQPLRRRVQRAVDRRFDRARYDGQRMTDAFAEQLRSEVDLARIRTSLATTANEAVRPINATVWLAKGSR